MDIRLPADQIAHQPLTRLIDYFGRKITYLRLSLTDRCNLRCFYCMQEGIKFLPRSEILTLEEMERLAAVFVRLGVTKLRLTGGEPLVRPGTLGLIERMGAWVKKGQLAELTLTTNGTLFERHASALAANGVRRVNVSLDTLDASLFERITHVNGMDAVLSGIDAARAAGIAVRVNAVAMAGINDRGFDQLIRWCGDHEADLALIELMPLCAAAKHYLSLEEVRHDLERRWTLTPLEDNTGGPARYWRVENTGRRIAFITPMSDSFCTRCNRLRITCTGQLVLCLGRKEGVDLRSVLRSAEADEVLEAAILDSLASKPAQHQFLGNGINLETRPMWQVGG
ncbi:GTP 3',8-cyclase MoaA [Uliginosibacterium gangwonense]|uniref:GTP 3',8-cyclase MoaA n=1 Tax=Uliginosibacterium gangwonense TaxID=392736 RepID=UPI000382218D|nr:GTP 3',8-cyclase MoaA [Uliginosibacterium gangwonense]